MRRRTTLLAPAALVSALSTLAACDTVDLPFVPSRTVSGSDTITLARSEVTVAGAGPSTMYTVTANELHRTVAATDGPFLADVSIAIAAEQRTAIVQATQEYIDKVGSKDPDSQCSDSGSHSVIVWGSMEYQSLRRDCDDDGPSPADIVAVLLEQTGESLPPVVRPDRPWRTELRHDEDDGLSMTVEGGTRNERLLADHSMSVTVQGGAPAEVSLSSQDSLAFLKSVNGALSEAPMTCEGSPRSLVISVPAEGRTGGPTERTIRLCGSSSAMDVASAMENLI